MNPDYINKLFEVLEKDPERYNRIMRKMNQGGSLRGYRRGKAPIPLLRNAIKNEPKPRGVFYQHVLAEYFPGEHMSDEAPESLNEIPDNIPGRMASFALHGKEDEFPMELIQRAAEAESVDLDETEAVTAETETVDESDHDEDEEKPSEAEAEVAVEQPPVVSEEEPKKLQTHEDTNKQVTKRKEKAMKTKYFGNMQVSSNYYNFYPYAIVNDDGTLTVLDSPERKDRFPVKGNINIYTTDRNSNILSQMFVPGVFYVLELPDEKEENYNRDGSRNITNYKVNINWLIQESAIHEPSEYGIYPVVSVAKMKEKLSSGVIIQFDNANYGFVKDELVLINEGPLLIGPCTATIGTGMIMTGLANKNYVLDAYIDDGTQFYNIPGIENIYGASYLSFACVKNLSVQKRDYISDELLIKELIKIVDNDKDEYVSIEVVLESAFSNMPIPAEVVKSRQERLKKIIAAQNDIRSLTGDIADIVNKMLLKAAGDNEDAFKELFEKLSKDPDFMGRFQRNQYIQGALDMMEDELDSKKKELQEIDNKLEASRERLENERADAINEEITQRQAELNAVKTELNEVLVKKNLVDDIQKLEVKRGVEEELLSKARKDHADIEKNIDDALKSFEEKAQKPIDQVTTYLLHERVAAAVDEQINKAGAPKAEGQNDTVKERCGFYTAMQNDATAGVTVEELCKRVSKYRSHYTKNEIVNLYLCVANGLLTVFSGAPGTGKTSICTILAHALGLDSYAVRNQAGDLWEDAEMANRFAVIPVERGWSSKRDFIGYYNPLTKSFDKANPYMYQALEIVNSEREMKVSTDQTAPYMVLLDEANLSPMEYYWADFMAVCDRMSSDAPIILGENKAFRITEALRFVATINNDHTTETLSPRLIDRAWVVALPQPLEASDTQFDDMYEPVSVQDIKRLFVKEGDVQLKSLFLDLLKEIYDFCKKQLFLNVSSRADIAIKHYCAAGESLFDKTDDGILGGYVAIDYAVAQKILPHIQGSGAKYNDKLVEFRNLLQRNNLIKSAEIVSRIIATGENNMMYFQYFA